VSVATYDFGAVVVRVTADRSEDLEDFRNLYDPRRRDDDDDAARVITMEVRRRRRWPFGTTRYRVLADGQEFSRPRHAGELLPNLEWGINQRVMDTRGEFLQLHAATLVRHGRGVVLAGASGAGKSTLAAALLARGWQYLCDEFALIDPATLRVHPYPKALCVKAGAFEIVEREGIRLTPRVFIKSWKGGVRYLRPTDVRPDAVGAASPVRHILFPNHHGHARPRAMPVSPGQAVFRLAGETLNQSEHPARGIPVLAALAREATCHVIDTGELDQTCSLIERIVTAGHTT
jgi:HprK-related kinase A